MKANKLAAVMRSLSQAYDDGTRHCYSCINLGTAVAQAKGDSGCYFEDIPEVQQYVDVFFGADYRSTPEYAQLKQLGRFASERPPSGDVFTVAVGEIDSDERSAFRAQLLALAACVVEDPLQKASTTLRFAARLLADPEERLLGSFGKKVALMIDCCCWAIFEAVNRIDGVERRILPEGDSWRYDEAKAYLDLFLPPKFWRTDGVDENKGTYWWGQYSDDLTDRGNPSIHGTDAHNERILALLLAADIAESEGN